MSRPRYKLTDAVVRKATKIGYHADGGGLYLQIKRANAEVDVTRNWVVRYRGPSGRMREMGLGPAAETSLKAARSKAEAARRLAQDGIDPISHREQVRQKAALEAALAVTFKQAAEHFLDNHERSWKNPKHRQQWRNTLKRYVYPVFGHLPVQSINTTLVLKVVEPIWKTKTETASRVRGRIEGVLNAAAARGQRTGENPARWRGHLDTILPRHAKVQLVEHHKAMPYRLLPPFFIQLQARDGGAARALEFTILTAARTTETLQAKWDEVDLVKSTWTIPAARMKAGRQHVVPLSPAATEILQRQQATH